jgi:VWFA-related protein
VALVVLLPFSRPLGAQTERSLDGKVVMQDGSPPPKPVAIERACGGRMPVRVAGTNKQGEFRFSEALVMVSAGECYWRAVLAGYESTLITIEDLSRSSRLPNIVLYSTSENVPSAAAPGWAQALRAMEEQRWTEAEGELRAILAQFPQSAPVWAQLGVSLTNQQRPEEARQAYQTAIEKAPWFDQAYHHLAALDMQIGEWEAAEKTVSAGLKKRPSAALNLDLAEIRFHLGAEGAEFAALQAIALDKKRELPRAEYVLGLILAEGEDRRSAATHLRKYLDLAPKTPEADDARARIRTLESGLSAEASAYADGSPASDPSSSLSPEAAAEFAVPGGMRALAAMTLLKSTPAPARFFLEYCRAIAAEAGTAGHGDTPDFMETVTTYFAVVAELSRLAEKGADRLTISTDTVSNYERAVSALKSLGWKLTSEKGAFVVEPSDLAADASRQLIPVALGMDEVEMAKSLAKGGSYPVEIGAERAPLVEPRAWRALAGRLPPGGIAEVFARNPQFAGAYSGLAAMSPEVAAMLVSEIGLRALVNRYATVLWFYGESFVLAGGRAAVPGGREAEPAWEKLTGVSPANPKAFFRALLTKDLGRLAAFYAALSRGDAAHQRFFTRTAASAERFYNWYRASNELRNGVNPMRASWREAVFQDLPLDESGRVYFPGRKEAWTDAPGADEDVLFKLASLEALVPLAKLEKKRKAPFDADSVRLLTRRYNQWKPLFPYFEKLPALAGADFQALAAFEQAVSGRPPAVRNTILGEWHSLIKLIELGSAAGSLDAAAGARAFRGVCVALSGPDYSARALAELQKLVGAPGDVEAVAAFLRLSGERRAAFNRVGEMQKSLSGVASPDERALAMLAGVVYAALLGPDILLVSEDPLLLSKHKFVKDAQDAPIFSSSSLTRLNESPGSFFEGGFMTFEESAQSLARGGSPGTIRTAAAAATPSPASGPAPVPMEPAFSPEAIFRTSVRLVEVYATVTDGRGRYVDDLVSADFEVLDDEVPAKVEIFESSASGVSVALALDTTGSMQAALPALKSAALRLIADLRPVDSVAVYAFNDKVSQLQSFTTNRDIARRAVLRTRVSGPTGFHDALVRVARDLSVRPGKKAIVVFTDGVDNASSLTSDSAIKRAKSEGVTIYTIAQGDALKSPKLLTQLETVAKGTGGLAFAVKFPAEIRAVFDHISQDLQHGYFLTFHPASDVQQKWHPITVALTEARGLTVRARQGYNPD